MEEEQKNTVAIKKTTIWKALSGLLFLLLLASIYTQGFGIFKTEAPTGGTVIQEQEPGAFDTSAWDLSDEPFLGDEDAPVTIIEFSDFECPFCARAANGPIKEVIKEYVETGKAKLIFRQLPLPFHSSAQVAAEAAECANEQGKFWELHDMIFANQGALSRANLIEWAKGIGITDIEECLDSGKYTAEVQADMMDGQSAGIQGTPSFLINGKLIVGAQPFEAFAQMIDAELG